MIPICIILEDIFDLGINLYKKGDFVRKSKKIREKG